MDIIECHEAFKTINGKFGFFCMKGIVRLNNKLYLASWKRRSRSEISQTELFDVKQLRTENRGPRLQAGWAVSDSAPDHYTKAPELYDYASDELESRMEKEIQICEILRQHPHPNLVTYHGCRVNNGYVYALCFSRYTATLLEAVNPQRLNKRQFISSGRPLVHRNMESKLDRLLEGIRHLHSLNLVHNDINPANVMQDGETGTLVLIDFGSCRYVGESLGGTAAKRTHEWHDSGVDVSSTQNDLRAFAELKAWLLGSVEELQW